MFEQGLVIQLSKRFTLCLLVTLMMVISGVPEMSAARSQARNQDRPVIRLHCMQEDGIFEARSLTQLCQHVVDALVHIAPKAIVRIVPDDQLTLTRQSDALLRLHMTQSAIYLTWQVGPKGPVHKAPEVGLAPYYSKQPGPGTGKTSPDTEGDSGGERLKDLAQALVGGAPHMRHDLKLLTIN